MKFKIYATCGWHREDELLKDYPCLEGLVDIMDIPFEKTRKIRDENGKVIEQVETHCRKVAYVTINSLEDLMNIVSSLETPIIVSCNTDGSDREIEIYDGYRE